jgi:hypothetical protein
MSSLATSGFGWRRHGGGRESGGDARSTSAKRLFASRPSQTASTSASVL